VSSPAAALSLAHSGMAGTAALVATPAANSEEDRKQKRELAAQRAEMRQAEIANRGVGSIKRTKLAANSPAKSSERSTAPALAAPAEAFSSKASPPAATPIIAGIAETAAPDLAKEETAQVDEEDEDEEAMMARAIALSLQTAKAGGAGTTKFKKLTGEAMTAAGSDSAGVTIDLDSD